MEPPSVVGSERRVRLVFGLQPSSFSSGLSSSSSFWPWLTHSLTQGTVNVYYDTRNSWPLMHHTFSGNFLEKLAQHFVFLSSSGRCEAALTGWSERSVTLSQAEEERNVWTNGKNDQALTIWWWREKRGKESEGRGQSSDQIRNKEQEEDGGAQSGCDRFSSTSD